jgi:hypothetical protein
MQVPIQHNYGQAAYGAYGGYGGNNFSNMPPVSYQGGNSYF